MPDIDSSATIYVPPWTYPCLDVNQIKPKSEFANRFATTVQYPHPLIYSLVIGVNLHFFLLSYVFTNPTILDGRTQSLNLFRTIRG
jgi:hypothetical protein